MPSYPHQLLVDTSFWFAFYEPRDKYHLEAKPKFPLLEKSQILLPWPSLYETLNTRFVKKPEYVKHFERIIRQPNAVVVDDAPYRETAYEMTWSMARKGKRPLSMVDMVIRFILDSVNIRVNYMLTFNPQDFADICRKRSIVLL